MTRQASRHVPSRTIYESLKRRGKRLASLIRSERGGVLAYVALCLPVLVGFGGLAVDVSSWYSKHRLGQVIVDAAVLGGAAELARTRSAATLATIQNAAAENAQLKTQLASNTLTRDELNTLRNLLMSSK